MLTSQLQLLGASPILSFCTQSNSVSQLPGYRPHRVQTTSNLFLNIQFHIIAPPGALTLLPPNLAPRVHPKQKKKKEIKSRSLLLPCWRGPWPGSPSTGPSRQESRALCTQRARLQLQRQERTCRQEQEQRPVCGEEEWEGRALPEESGSLVIPGCTRELPGSRGLPLAG